MFLFPERGADRVLDSYNLVGIYGALFSDDEASCLTSRPLNSFKESTGSCYFRSVKSSCLLALILLPLNACSFLFDENKAELSDASPEVDASTGAGLYSLEAKWQTSTQGATGNIGMGPNGIPAFAGHFSGTVELNQQSYVSAGGFDLLLAHLDASTGEFLRVASYGAMGEEFVLSLSVGANNEMVLGGGLSGSRTNVGGEHFDANNPTPSHGYVARYTTELEHAWSLLYKSNSNNASVNGISAENGAVYVAGGYGGDLSLPDVDLDVVELVGQEGLAAYFGKYDANGKFTGGQTAFSGQGNERCEIAIGDGSNSAYIAGSFSEEITFATAKASTCLPVQDNMISSSGELRTT